ncbi:MAG TPA: hypothetical protein VE130_10510 [Nitrososphaeraceae archaeon]|nr:hypothetical protein [Nitrososphaeraceae archaeon]
MRKRPCKHCGTEIYLQYVPVTPILQWISFEASDGKLHSCPNRPLDFMTKKLIGEAIERMSYSSNNISLLLNNIDTIIGELKGLKHGLIRIAESN